MGLKTRILFGCAVAGVVAWSAGSARGEVMFDWATVGNAGNSEDPLNSVSVPGIGAVGYEYRIAKHEVTNAQYTEFLNAVDPDGANTNDVYNPSMSSFFVGGINLDGNAGTGSKYSVKLNQGNQPVVFVSWLDAARFTNWLHNGQGMGNTEAGVYDMSQANPSRDPNATFFIPTENEWYKAAFHKNDGVTGNYFLYATGSNSEPDSDKPSDNAAGANYFNQANGLNNGFAVTGSTVFSFTQNYLTDVGAYTLAGSPYGTFDQNGNVDEWNEDLFSSALHRFLGGSWGINEAWLRSSSFGFTDFPTKESGGLGFRVASLIPEPGTFFVLAIGGALVAGRRGRRRGM